MWMLYNTKKNAIKSIGVSQPICSQCKEYLDLADVTYTKKWTKGVSPKWSNPWQRLGETDPYNKDVNMKVEE
jgi:hypothetical protein